jgi:putative transposase
MAYNPTIRHRRSIRLGGYDYSVPDAYYITICVEEAQCLLGEVVLRQMVKNDAGRMVGRVWKSIPTRSRQRKWMSTL